MNNLIIIFAMGLGSITIIFVVRAIVLSRTPRLIQEKLDAQDKRMAEIEKDIIRLEEKTGPIDILPGQILALENKVDNIACHNDLMIKEIMKSFTMLRELLEKILERKK